MPGIVPITSLTPADPLSGSETIVVVQDGLAKQTSAAALTDNVEVAVAALDTRVIDLENAFPVPPSGAYEITTQTIWVPASAMSAPDTFAASQNTYQSLTSLFLPTYDFDPDTASRVVFNVNMPKSWDGGDITATVNWFVTDTPSSSGDVVWQLDASLLEDGSDLNSISATDFALITDTYQGVELFQVSSESNPIVMGDAGGQKQLYFTFWRSAAAIEDTLDVNARLVGVVLKYKTKSYDDS